VPGVSAALHRQWSSTHGGSIATAFRWVEASWDNASRGVPSDSKVGEQGRDSCHTLATRSSATSGIRTRGPGSATSSRALFTFLGK
jgi:hypothetical protein